MPDLLAGDDEEALDLWEILLLITRVNEFGETAVKSLELSFFAKYIFQLAQKFNNVYHKYPILNEEDENKRNLRILVAGLFLKHMVLCLCLLGNDVPEKM